MNTSTSSSSELRIDAPRSTVYDALLKLGDWWPHRTREGSYVVLESHVGGRLYEDWDTGGSLWGTVSRIEQDARLTVTGLMDLPDAVAGRFDLRLADADGGATQVSATHQAVGGFTAESTQEFQARWDAVLAALRDYVVDRRR